MDSVDLFQIQTLLDHRIEKEHDLSKGKVKREKIFAFITEVVECANEWRGFKFWSQDQEPRRENMLEEYVDCLHFLLSIGLYLPEYKQGMIDFGAIWNQVEPDEDVLTRFEELLHDAVFLMSDRLIQFWFKELATSFLALGKALGFSWKEVVQAYLAKNKINHERQDTGY